MTPMPSYFGGVPVEPNRLCWGQSEEATLSVKLLLEVVQPMSSRYLNVTDGQTV